MCGICGFNWNNQELIKSMSKVLEHRGPDGKGHYTNKGISLGHRRLSIIDLSSAGKQPMTNENETIWITYNGEIYNFQELRKILEDKGHRFKSNTDTEVLVHGYEEWGEQVVEKLNGMFAFAIWDDVQKKLFLARDHLGIKPLYYYWNGKEFVFASEIKAILQEPSIPRIVNRTAANKYFSLRYIPGEDTLFAGIKKLLPGHTAILQKNNLTIRQFWDLPIPQNKYQGKNVKNLLEDSVKRRLVADVPVGVYLSGGIDSASLVGLASKLKSEPIKTFSVGFNYNDKVDELQKAGKIAQHFQTDHHEIVVEGSIKELLPKIIWKLDMPHGDPVVVPMFRLSELASQKVKVVLSGEGADELFGGYMQYKTFQKAQKIKYLPFKKIAAQVAPVKLLDQFFDYPSSIGEKGKEKLVEFFGNLKDEKKAYLDLVSTMSNRDQKLLLNKIPENKTPHRSKLRNIFNVCSGSKATASSGVLGLSQTNQEEPEKQTDYFQQRRKPLLNRMLYYDTKTWLPNYVLFINDRMTMANSIEGRVPFLDHRLVEYANQIHPELKRNKLALRQAMRNVIPQHKTKKHAFFMPLDKWYKEELKGMAEEMFTPSSVKERGYFNYHHLRKVWENYPQSKLLYGKQLFTLINFELWHRKFIDQ